MKEESNDKPTWSYLAIAAAIVVTIMLMNLYRGSMNEYKYLRGMLFLVPAGFSFFGFAVYNYWHRRNEKGFKTESSLAIIMLLLLSLFFVYGLAGVGEDKRIVCNHIQDLYSGKSIDLPLSFGKSLSSEEVKIKLKKLYTDSGCQGSIQ